MVDRSVRTRMLILATLLSLAIVPAGLAEEIAKAPQEDPLIDYATGVYHGVKAILAHSAEKVGEEHYGFKPTESVRSFGGVLAHATSAQYFFCSTVLGDEAAAPKLDENASKAELIEALEGAFSYCDRAYATMNTTTATETVMMMGSETPKLGALMTNNLHLIEHYGNLITYMRMLDIVPPTSEPGFMETLQQ